MVSADIALVQLINRTAAAYVSHAPTYITYREFTHVGSNIGRAEDINRYVAARQADDFAVMQDLPQGAQRTGQAFPIIPFFDPFAGFSYSWFANLKRIDITLTRNTPVQWHIPAPDPAATITIPYISFWAPAYAPDSTPERTHLVVTPTPALPIGDLYPADVVIDPQTQLPSHLEIRFAGDPTTSISLDYQTIDGYWVITHATYSAPQHFGPLNFTVTTDTSYQDIAFPVRPPDPRLAASPTPSPVPSATP